MASVIPRASTRQQARQNSNTLSMEEEHSQHEEVQGPGTPVTQEQFGDLVRKQEEIQNMLRSLLAQKQGAAGEDGPPPRSPGGDPRHQREKGVAGARHNLACSTGGFQPSIELFFCLFKRVSSKVHTLLWVSPPHR